MHSRQLGTIPQRGSSVDGMLNGSSTAGTSPSPVLSTSGPKQQYFKAATSFGRSKSATAAAADSSAKSLLSNTLHSRLDSHDSSHGSATAVAIASTSGSMIGSASPVHAGAPAATRSSGSTQQGSGMFVSQLNGWPRAKVVAYEILQQGGKDMVVYKVRAADDKDEWTVTKRWELVLSHLAPVYCLVQ